MTWVTPFTGLLLAAAVIPPLILLYFLKLRRMRQPIACTLLWKRSVEDIQANTPFQRLRRNILLLLQLLALLLLIVSVMQPQVQAGQHAGGRVVFLIDNSASMSADDLPGGRTRLEEARRLARERIEAIYGGGLLAGSPGETMIIAFSDRAEIISRFSDVRQNLTAAIDRVEPTDGETRLDEALRLARAYTMNVVDEMGEARPTGEPAHLELFSDGRIADLAEHVLRGETITYHPIGTAEPDNVAFAAIAAERPFDRPTAIEIFASLLNFNEREVVCDVQLSVDGAARSIREVPLPAARIDPATGERIPGRNNVIFAPFEQPRGAIIELANLREDDLMADNTAQLVVPAPKRLRVALVAPQSFLIRSVLEGMALEDLEILPAERFAQLAEDGRTEAYDVIVLDNHAPEALAPGRYLSFGATPPLEGFNEYGRGERQVVLTTRDEHPVMRYVNLEQLFISEFTLLQPRDDIEVLAEGPGGPLVLALSRGPRHLVHVTFDPAYSNWPFLRSFVTFIVNAVEHLGHIGEAVASKGLRPGEAITARVPPGAGDVRLLTPDGTAHRLSPPEDGELSWGPVRQAGAYILSWTDAGGPQSRPFAVNFLSQSEGDLRMRQDIEFGQDRVAGRPARQARATPLWPWALALCLALLMIEWWVYHRKAFF